MAKHKYLPTGALFDDDESDVEDDGAAPFRSRIPRPLPKETGTNQNVDSENKKQLTIQKILAIQERTLQSAERSINMLRETEEVGISAAGELVNQGERLQNASKALDEIDSNLKESQKHINGIKSVFYGIKNYISGKSRSPSPCRHQLSSHKQSPKFGRSTFYPTDSPHKSKCANASLHNLDVESSAGPSSKQVDDILETNLQEMAYHLKQLKVLGIDFGKEIDHQNEIIDILHDKVDQADIKIHKQNNEMDNILGK